MEVDHGGQTTVTAKGDEPISTGGQHPRLKSFIKRWWFPAMMGVMVLAHFFPWVGRKGGPLYPAVSVKVAVGLVFLMTGFALKFEVLLKAMLHVRLHILVQSFSLIVIPLFFFGLTLLLALTSFDPSLSLGMIVLAALPTTVATNVVFTKAAGGNHAAALFNASFGNIVGVFVAPAWIFAITGVTSDVSFGHVLLNLTYMILAPLAGGQLLRAAVRHRVDEKKIPTSILAHLVLLFVIYTNFCDTFSAGIALSVGSVVLLAGILVGAHILFLITVWLVSGIRRWSWARFTMEDRVAILYCAAAKTLGMGLPLLSVMYDTSPNLGLISIPLMVYHPLSILIAGLINPALKRKVEQAQDREAEEEQRRSAGRLLHVESAAPV